MPPQPDGGIGWDPNQVAGGTSTSSSAQKSLWDLNGLNENTPIAIGSAPKRINHLDPGDAAIAEASRVTPTGLPADLVKYPIQQYSDPKKYLQLQQALFAAGFYGSTPASSIPWGSDPQGSTYDAWKKVLIATQQAQSAGMNVTPLDLLSDAVKRHQAATAGATVPKPGMVIQTTDPAALAGIVQQAAQSALGRNLSKDEVTSFVQEFHAQEQAFSKRAYAAQQDTSGRTFNMTQPDASAQAQQFVDQGHPTEAGGQQLAGYLGVLHSLLNGG